MKQKEKKHGSTAAAAVFMAVAIVASMPLGVNRSFARMRENTVSGQYYYDKSGYAIWEGVDTCEETARNLITVAKKYEEANPQLSKLIANLEYSTQVSENTYEVDDETYTAIRAANAELVADAHALHDALEEVELDEKDAKYPRELIADMEAECDKMARSSYNDEAQDYNRKLSAFPARLFQKIAQVDYMATFYDTESYSVPIAVESSADVTE